VPYTQAWSGAVAVKATMSDEEFALAFITATVVFLVYIIVFLIYIIVVIECIK
jgi:heme/copper-type cytochrome/quinol oxidase subunit 2